MSGRQEFRFAKGELKRRVSELADGSMTSTEIARAIGASKESVNGVVQRHDLSVKKAGTQQQIRRTARETKERLAQALGVLSGVADALEAFSKSFQEAPPEQAEVLSALSALQAVTRSAIRRIEAEE